jgi:hypothetical protein
MSSPSTPSPRVAPCTKRPSSYLSDTDSPSILGSAVNTVSASGSSLRKRRIWSTKPSTSSRSKALSSDSIATLWRTLANFSAGGAPTRVEGESGRTSSGKRTSMAALRCRSASYSASEMTGRSSW